MNKAATTIRRELGELLPPTLFFFVVFHVIAFVRGLMLEDFGITATTSVGATVGALIVGKAILIADKLPFVDLFPNRASVYNAVWKTGVYGALALGLQFLEEFVPLLVEHQGVVAASRHVVEQVHWPRFWGTHILLVLFLFFYCAAAEVIRTLGAARFTEIFLGLPARKRTP
jgi:hypothetical protein